MRLHLGQRSRQVSRLYEEKTRIKLHNEVGTANNGTSSPVDCSSKTGTDYQKSKTEVSTKAGIILSKINVGCVKEISDHRWHYAVINSSGETTRHSIEKIHLVKKAESIGFSSSKSTTRKGGASADHLQANFSFTITIIHHNKRRLDRITGTAY